MLPSIKTLDRAFPGKGRELRKALQSWDYVAEHPAGVARKRECYSAPKRHDVRLHVLDAIAETYGVESFEIRPNQWVDYLNTGDTYNATIVRYPDGRYRVQDVGSIIERMPQYMETR